MKVQARPKTSQNFSPFQNFQLLRVREDAFLGECRDGGSSSAVVVVTFSPVQFS